ncbi:hypothetical protein SteCoe_2587 [Stentor coeruleus]|uniref:Uncharacterized protein n=1 Tax=Stentor coeruleus TaxID=5963 RepID=A0A1R2CZ34_9CILI|nr:hypothetical protein SteCoe_2587 [Stentor coeruleus]
MGACISKKQTHKLQKHSKDPKSNEIIKKTSLQTSTSSLTTPTFYSKILTRIVLRQPVLQDLKQNKLYASRMQKNDTESTTAIQNIASDKKNYVFEIGKDSN